MRAMEPFIMRGEVGSDLINQLNDAEKLWYTAKQDCYEDPEKGPYPVPHRKYKS